jgi:hypothetical protein
MRDRNVEGTSHRSILVGIDPTLLHAQGRSGCSRFQIPKIQGNIPMAHDIGSSCVLEAPVLRTRHNRTLPGFHYNGLHKIAWLGWALGLASVKPWCFMFQKVAPRDKAGSSTSWPITRHIRFGTSLKHEYHEIRLPFSLDTSKSV